MNNKRAFTKVTRADSWQLGYLTQSEAFFREKECLTVLNKNFKCVCSKPRTHFPKIIEYDENKFEFKLTHQGGELDRQNIKSLKGITEQIKCIAYNLKKNEIVHRDIVLRNFCVSEDGDLSLIDFDEATIGKTKHPDDAYDYDATQGWMIKSLVGLAGEDGADALLVLSCWQRQRGLKG